MTQLTWDLGTAYDLFISLHVLHRPNEFGLRPSWAAGVRSRLGARDRATLERAHSFLPVPLGWIDRLPEPKDAATALQALEQTRPGDRLRALFLSFDTPPEITAILLRITAAGEYFPADLEALRAAYVNKGAALRLGAASALCEAWLQPAIFGEEYLSALSAYTQNFFAEEEQRIVPFLKDSLAQAQDLASRMDLPALLEELSGGVSFEALLETPEITLVPSYWSKPLVFFSKISPERAILLFGSRPAPLALVPGEAVPETLLNALKALDDPTRLRILRYLGEQPHTPTQLARRLRLRPPTVIHHLRLLRLAGLVHVILESEAERRYAARPEAVGQMVEELGNFLGTGPNA